MFRYKYVISLLCTILWPIQHANSEDMPDANTPSNQEVLNDWQATSGQSGTISDKNGGTLEWHGQVTEDVYNVDTSFDQPNDALSGLREGTFSLTRLEGDLRNVEQAGDVTYIQGGVTLSRDRAKQSLYSSQISNFQFGRAGAGYQLSAGDVVADFSKIGSNLGLRGLFGAKQIDALTLYSYAGIVTTGWESLFNESTLTGQPPRSKYLRDVIGFKADYKLNEQWSVFGTAQTFSDRQSSLNALQKASLIAQNGATGTAGVSFKNNQAAFSAEVGTSHNGLDTANGLSFGDAAFLIDASYAWQTINVHAGHHNIGLHYTSLAQNVVPGIRESFVGGDWFITPSLSYGNDIRRSETRTTDVFGSITPTNLVDSFTNRLTYNVTQIPGLNFSLQDMRNWGQVGDNKNSNSTSQLGIFYATQHYSGGATFSNSRQKTNLIPNTSSITDGVQLSVGRQFLEGELLALPTISGGIQLNGGYQQQRIANGTQTSSGNQGVSINAQSKKIGQFQASFTNMDTRQPNGRALLNTKVVNLDWSKTIASVLALKAYIRNNYRNHGDSIQTVDEKIVGVQADYQW